MALFPWAIACRNFPPRSLGFKKRVKRQPWRPTRQFCHAISPRHARSDGPGKAILAVG